MRLLIAVLLLACTFPPAAQAQSRSQGPGVIVGIVVDADQLPVPRARVQAFSPEAVNKATGSPYRLGLSAASASTDASGRFRISGLPLGEYLVAAEAPFVFPDGGPMAARLYGPTFYPSTLDVSKALFADALDRPMTTVQIALAPVTPVRIRGTAASVSGRPTEGFDGSDWTSWLDHQDRHIRANVAFIFASLGDPRGLETIVGILNDRSERPEGQGIPGVAGDGRYQFEQQVAADRYYAAHILGDLRDSRGVALLVPLLDDRETQPIVPWSLAQTGDRRAIPPLIAALDNDDPSHRVTVIYALVDLHAKEAIPRLLTLVNDEGQSRFGTLVSVSEAAKSAIASINGTPR